MYKIASKSIVVVLAYKSDLKKFNQGSGVVFASNMIGTNCHVIENGVKIVVLYSGKSYPATGVHRNKVHDACVIRTEGLPASTAVMAPLTSIQPGQRVYSIGSPRGLDLTIAEGLISGLRLDNQGTSSIQTSAPISPGSSGGGLFDEYGRVVGITTSFVRDSQNLNFAIPIEELLK